MTDLDLIYTIIDSHGTRTPVRVMYESISDSHAFVSGVFRERDDSEIDFHTLPLETREDILSKCREAVLQRKQEQQ